jgi:hypothetical protein
MQELIQGSAICRMVADLRTRAGRAARSRSVGGLPEIDTPQQSDGLSLGKNAFNNPTELLTFTDLWLSGESSGVDLANWRSSTSLILGFLEVEDFVLPPHVAF